MVPGLNVYSLDWSELSDLSQMSKLLKEITTTRLQISWKPCKYHTPNSISSADLENYDWKVLSAQNCPHYQKTADGIMYNKSIHKKICILLQPLQSHCYFDKLNV
mgnify:CR=1 FL=1